MNAVNLSLLFPAHNVCSICFKWFSSRSTLYKHKVWHHKSVFPDFKYVCNKCPYATDNKTNFKTHYDVHEPDRPYKCDICGNGFKRLASLSHHMIIHTGDVPIVW